MNIWEKYIKQLNIKELEDFVIENIPTNVVYVDFKAKKKIDKPFPPKFQYPEIV